MSYSDRNQMVVSSEDRILSVELAWDQPSCVLADKDKNMFYFSISNPGSITTKKQGITIIC